MNNYIRIALSSALAAIAVSLLYFIVPITDTFIVAHIFSLVAIVGIAVSVCIFGKGNNKAPQGFAYIYTAIAYAIVSTVASVIACVVLYIKPFPIAVTIVMHIVILLVFVIRVIALSAGNEYIEKVEEIAEEKHKEFEKEKVTYWR